MLQFPKTSLTAIFMVAVTILSAQSQKLSVESIFKTRAFSTKGVSGISPLTDGTHYARLQNDTLVAYSYKTGQRNGWLATGKEMITSSGDTLPLHSYILSSDEKKMLIPAETESIYRHSTQSEFYIWDRTTRKLSRLTENGKQRLADFSPDGSKVAFVRHNNLFIRDLFSNTEKAITTDGLENSIINGTTDWVYEEEFGFTKGFHWSPDGSKIAWLRFDESAVPEYWLTMYGDLYPSNQKYKYPKAGEANSIVTVHVFDLASGKTTKIDAGDISDQYIPRMQWTNQKGQLAIQRLNRLQNKLELLLADASTGISKVVYTDENKAYVQITDDLTFLSGTDQFVITSERDGFNHIYLCDSKGSVQQLTRGEWDVVSVKGFDPVRQLIWFDAAINGAVNRDICHVNLKGKTTTVTDHRGWNIADFNSDFSFFILNWSDINNPPVISVKDWKGKTIRILEDNARLREQMKVYALRKRELFTMKTTGGTELNGWMIKPEGYDATKQYPVLMYVYGGPGSQTVKNSWDRGQLWYQYLAQEGILVVSVDNRGTGFRGNDFKKMTYLQLGKYET
ncbi:MAG TPA: S9 family peptidase, partial [Bacteroidales bacterium]|nr:S9 family peptidase [Bacteroidales bacterium]